MKRGMNRMGSSTVTAVTIYGNNADCDSLDVVGALSTAPTAIIAADELQIQSGGNVADIYSGAGAREVTVVGLNSSWDVISEVIQTKGAAASAQTTQQFIRLNAAWVNYSGTVNAANTGAIVIENAAGTDLGTIPAGAGNLSQAFYTIPDGYTGYVASFDVTSTAGDKFIGVFTRTADDVTTPFPGIRARMVRPGFDGYTHLLNPIEARARTDVWLGVVTGVDLQPCSAAAEIYLVPDVSPTPAAPTPIPSPTPTP